MSRTQFLWFGWKALTHFSQVDHLGLFSIDLQIHPNLQFGLDPAVEPVTLVARQHHTVVSISHQPGIGPIGRTIRTLVQADLLAFRQKHVSGQAPWLHGHYPASRLLWACPTPDQSRHRVMSSPRTLWLGPLPAGPPTFLDQSVSTGRPLSPRKARQLHTPVASLPAVGFTYPGRMATFAKSNEAETGSLALRLALSPHEDSRDRVTPSPARSATCQTGNLQGEHISEETVTTKSACGAKKPL